MALAFAVLGFTEQCVNPVFSTKIKKHLKRGAFFMVCFESNFDYFLFMKRSSK